MKKELPFRILNVLIYLSVKISSFWVIGFPLCNHSPSIDLAPIWKLCDPGVVQQLTRLD